MVKRHGQKKKSPGHPFRRIATMAVSAELTEGNQKEFANSQGKPTLSHGASILSCLAVEEPYSELKISAIFVAGMASNQQDHIRRGMLLRPGRDPSLLFESTGKSGFGQPDTHARFEGDINR